MTQPASPALPQTRLPTLLPGVLLCAAIAVLAWALHLLGKQVAQALMLDALVIAILLGMLVRNTVLRSTLLNKSLSTGVSFTAKQVLETAVALLGATVSFPVLFQAGGTLLAVIVGVVTVSILLSRVVGGWFGLNPKLAVLVACGNSICGNSAIAAVAPVIKATAEDVASAIALTAVLGVLMVLGLPLLVNVLNLSFYQYGVLTGLTVYAVPQVVAAAFPVSALSGQVATLVKLVRVLLLGPVVLFFALRHNAQEAAAGQRPARPKFTQLVPWFILGFLGLATLRSVGLLPDSVAQPLRDLSKWLTVASMAALGLGVDMAVVRKVGWRVAATVVCSLLLLLTLSVIAIKLLNIQ